VLARLVSLDGNADIPLDRAVLLVGRHLRCDARIDSRRVSRLHCCLAWDHGELNVRDLGSTNGTRINGRPAEAGRLRAGDELSIAHLRYRLESGRPRGDASLAERRRTGHRPPALSRGRMT
jgi:pSer/pThr/pTyr-binding forkhead associated (FHA) protein